MPEGTASNLGEPLTPTSLRRQNIQLSEELEALKEEGAKVRAAMLELQRQAELQRNASAKDPTPSKTKRKRAPGSNASSGRKKANTANHSDIAIFAKATAVHYRLFTASHAVKVAIGPNAFSYDDEDHPQLPERLDEATGKVAVELREFLSNPASPAYHQWEFGDLAAFDAFRGAQESFRSTKASEVRSHAATIMNLNSQVFASTADFAKAARLEQDDGDMPTLKPYLENYALLHAGCGTRQPTKNDLFRSPQMLRMARCLFTGTKSITTGTVPKGTQPFRDLLKITTLSPAILACVGTFLVHICSGDTQFSGNKTAGKASLFGYLSVYNDILSHAIPLQAKKNVWQDLVEFYSCIYMYFEPEESDEETTSFDNNAVGLGASIMAALGDDSDDETPAEG